MKLIPEVYSLNEEIGTLQNRRETRLRDERLTKYGQ